MLDGRVYSSIKKLAKKYPAALSYLPTYFFLNFIFHSLRHYQQSAGTCYSFASSDGSYCYICNKTSGGVI